MSAHRAALQTPLMYLRMFNLSAGSTLLTVVELTVPSEKHKRYMYYDSVIRVLQNKYAGNYNIYEVYKTIYISLYNFSYIVL